MNITPKSFSTISLTIALPCHVVILGVISKVKPELKTVYEKRPLIYILELTLIKSHLRILLVCDQCSCPQRRLFLGLKCIQCKQIRLYCKHIDEFFLDELVFQNQKKTIFPKLLAGVFGLF
jgi:hypothetical protein